MTALTSEHETMIKYFSTRLLDDNGSKIYYD